MCEGPYPPGLVSFMYDVTPTTGSVNTTREVKRKFAAASMVGPYTASPIPIS